MENIKRTEKLLYSRALFKKTINKKREYIQELLEYGLPEGTNYGLRIGGGVKRDRTEIIDDMIQALEVDIFKAEMAIDHVEKALTMIEHDAYYPIIYMRYQQNMQIEEIAEELAKSVASIQRHKQRLLLELSIFFFTEEHANEICNF